MNTRRVPQWYMKLQRFNKPIGKPVTEFEVGHGTCKTSQSRQSEMKFSNSMVRYAEQEVNRRTINESFSVYTANDA